MRHAGSCHMMAKLPSVLKDGTHNNVPSRGVLLAIGAAIAPPRSNGATEYAGCPIELETAADLHASGSCGSQDQNLYFQCRLLDQNHTEHSEGIPVAVELAAAWVFGNWASAVGLGLYEWSVLLEYSTAVNFEHLA